MAASMSEKNAALKKRTEVPTGSQQRPDSFVGGLGGRRACASFEQVFFGCDKKMKVQ
jgi:hypothetical protein